MAFAGGVDFGLLVGGFSGNQFFVHQTTWKCDNSVKYQERRIQKMIREDPENLKRLFARKVTLDTVYCAVAISIA